MFKKAWDSPTLMTWLSYSTKALSLFGVLPLILRKFTPGDIVLWYLFSTIISLQSIADFGFRQTFSRIISYAFGGAQDITVFKNDKSQIVSFVETGPNRPLLTSIVSTMKSIYIWLTIIVFVLMGITGTWAMAKPVNSAANVSQGWVCWIIVLSVSCLGFYGKIYMNFLEGLYKIALVRRIETLTSTGSILTSIFVLYWAPSILNLVIVNQFWVLLVTYRDWYLCGTVEDGLYKEISKKLSFDKEIFKKIWQPAWRSGISGFMSVGLTNLTGLIYAQLGTTASVASYLLALRVISQIREISMAPFYSKLPLFAMLRVKNDVPSLVKLIKRGMFLSHMVYVVAFVAVGLLSGYIIHLLHSEVHFVNQTMWLLLGFAFFIHRYGAMHIQVYLSTNHIISHIADGVSGILYIISAYIFSRYFGIYAVPLGMLVGYLGFYAWYSALFSYSSIKVNFFDFESKVSLVPVVLLIIYALFVCTFKNIL